VAELAVIAILTLIAVIAIFKGVEPQDPEHQIGCVGSIVCGLYSLLLAAIFSLLSFLLARAPVVGFWVWLIISITLLPPYIIAVVWITRYLEGVRTGQGRGFGFSSAVMVGAVLPLIIVGARSFAERSIRITRLYDEDPGTPIFRGTASRAREAANNRRSYLLSTFDQHSPVPYEIIEKPPGYEESPDFKEPLDAISLAAQMAALMYQASSEQALLFGRVIDAVVCISRKLSVKKVRELENVDVALRPLRWYERRVNSFPWIAVIGTDCPELFREPLSNIRDWLGIGVNLRPVANLQPQRGCKHSGERGTVAGFIQYLSKTGPVDYALTCAHVIPATCMQTRIPENQESIRTRTNGLVPDATLLTVHECLADGKRVPLELTSQSMLDQIILNRMPVERLGGYSPMVDGYVKHELRCYPINGILSRFPACTVAARRLRYFGIAFPLRRRSFSVKGDSGSWVVFRPKKDEDGTFWLGMVQAGNRAETTVLLGSPLLVYLGQLLKEEPLAPAYLAQSC
jgi:hypothetical protein